MNIVIVSGGFDPIHSGHIDYFNAAKQYGDYLIVALNSDSWLRNKKNKPFMSFDERKIIIENLSMVDQVIDFEDDENGSATNALEKIKNLYPDKKIIFCNGGDREAKNIPEMNIPGIDFKFGGGGTNKKNSSSWLLKNFQFNKEDRLWGEFINLFEDKKIKLKELVIHPRKGMSFQRHFFRSEIWFISKGKCQVKFAKDNSDDAKQIDLGLHESFHVPMRSWHQIFNPYNEPCHIIEIQFGDLTSEDDIERIEFYDND